MVVVSEGGRGSGMDTIGGKTHLCTIRTYDHIIDLYFIFRFFFPSRYTYIVNRHTKTQARKRKMIIISTFYSQLQYFSLTLAPCVQYAIIDAQYYIFKWNFSRCVIFIASFLLYVWFFFFVVYFYFLPSRCEVFIIHPTARIHLT